MRNLLYLGLLLLLVAIVLLITILCKKKEGYTAPISGIACQDIPSPQNIRDGIVLLSRWPIMNDILNDQFIFLSNPLNSNVIYSQCTEQIFDTKPMIDVAVCNANKVVKLTQQFKYDLNNYYQCDLDKISRLTDGNLISSNFSPIILPSGWELTAYFFYIQSIMRNYLLNKIALSGLDLMVNKLQQNINQVYSGYISCQTFNVVDDLLTGLNVTKLKDPEGNFILDGNGRAYFYYENNVDFDLGVSINLISLLCNYQNQGSGVCSLFPPYGPNSFAPDGQLFSNLSRGACSSVNNTVRPTVCRLYKDIQTTINPTETQILDIRFLFNNFVNKLINFIPKFAQFSDEDYNFIKLMMMLTNSEIYGNYYRQMNFSLPILGSYAIWYLFNFSLIDFGVIKNFVPAYDSGFEDNAVYKSFNGNFKQTRVLQTGIINNGLNSVDLFVLKSLLINSNSYKLLTGNYAREMFIPDQNLLFGINNLNRNFYEDPNDINNLSVLPNTFWSLFGINTGNNVYSSETYKFYDINGFDVAKYLIYKAGYVNVNNFNNVGYILPVGTTFINNNAITSSNLEYIGGFGKARDAYYISKCKDCNEDCSKVQAHQGIDFYVSDNSPVEVKCISNCKVLSIRDKKGYILSCDRYSAPSGSCQSEDCDCESICPTGTLCYNDPSDFGNNCSKDNPNFRGKCVYESKTCPNDQKPVKPYKVSSILTQNDDGLLVLYSGLIPLQGLVEGRTLRKGDRIGNINPDSKMLHLEVYSNIAHVLPWLLLGTSNVEINQNLNNFNASKNKLKNAGLSENNSDYIHVPKPNCTSCNTVQCNYNRRSDLINPELIYMSKVLKSGNAFSSSPFLIFNQPLTEQGNNVTLQDDIL